METMRPSESQQNDVQALDRENPERLSRLQKLICELLAKNQRLRVELMAKRVTLGPDKPSSGPKHPGVGHII